MNEDRSNSPSAAAIEAIVREVLARLSPESSERGPSAAGRTAAGQPTGQNQLSPASATLAISARVVTTNELAGRLVNVREVFVIPRAVVTPAARDLLASHRIRLSSGPPPQPTARQRVGDRRLTLGCVDAGYDPAPLVRALQHAGVAAELASFQCLIGAVDELARRVQGGAAKAALLSSRTAAAVCLANRLHGVRAVQVRDHDELMASLADVDANLLIVRPAGQTLFVLRRIIGSFAAAPPASPGLDVAARLHP